MYTKTVCFSFPNQGVKISVEVSCTPSTPDRELRIRAWLQITQAMASIRIHKDDDEHPNS